jgi:hypothetical protein
VVVVQSASGHHRLAAQTTKQLEAIMPDDDARLLPPVRYKQYACCSPFYRLQDMLYIHSHLIESSALTHMSKMFM